MIIKEKSYMIRKRVSETPPFNLIVSWLDSRPGPQPGNVPCSGEGGQERHGRPKDCGPLCTGTMFVYKPSFTMLVHFRHFDLALGPSKSTDWNGNVVSVTSR
ncbi:hypothetical protein ElyMa_006949300 [Elysia marginata]|uniref:Uncharacterized protein n=1 Tax=Elysia marginata TaxID=1093978 RepID=A0AAV4JJV4_9GAST|nr:hypothetical protein ElyMa_006949300 [Elysia marginata]